MFKSQFTKKKSLKRTGNCLFLATRRTREVEAFSSVPAPSSEASKLSVRESELFDGRGFDTTPCSPLSSKLFSNLLLISRTCRGTLSISTLYLELTPVTTPGFQGVVQRAPGGLTHTSSPTSNSLPARS